VTTTYEEEEHDMPIELKMLVWSVVLTVVQMLIHVSGATLQVGLPKLAGNREGLPEATGWVGRARRAHLNMLESLVLFAALALVVVVAQRANATTALGAQIFFWGRLGYALVYLAGIPWLRTMVWLVSMIGLVMMLSQVF